MFYRYFLEHKKNNYNLGYEFIILQLESGLLLNFF